MKIAVLGPKGTFTEIAALKYFHNEENIELVMTKTIREVFEKVETNQATFGVVGIENSRAGSVYETMDKFIDSDIKIIGEIFIPIKHALLMAPNTKKEEITKILAHPQAIIQCQQYLEKNFKHVDKIEVSSNAKAAEIISSETGTAAIAPESAAEHYGLEILEKSVQDTTDNTTRFFIITPKTYFYEKTKNLNLIKKHTLIFAINDKPGSLYNTLGEFSKRNINLTKIESRPSKDKSWEYLFFIEFEDTEPKVNMPDFFSSLEKTTLYIKLLGSYPKFQNPQNN